MISEPDIQSMVPKLEKAYEIRGWMSGTELDWLARRARFARVIIEFGCYCGRSTRALADNTKALIFAVDPWESQYFDKDGKQIGILIGDSYEQFRTNLKEYIESGQLEMFRCRSEEFPIIEDSGYADFIFLDGDHRYEEVKKDLILAEKLAIHNGIISGHDYTHSDWPGVKQAVDERYGVENVNVIDSIWWVVKS